jgi:mono/diheme cytochrome c family protein
MIASAAPVFVLVLGTARPAMAQDTAMTSLTRGATLYSRTCQRCHNLRGPGEWTDREWVIIMQHMETRANLTVEHAKLIRTFLLASNAAAQAPGRERAETMADTTRPEITANLLDTGRQIFHGQGVCASCHGADMGGTAVAPNLKDGSWRNGSGSYADILSVVRNGVGGTAMAPYPGGISDEMAKQVAAYIWAVSHGQGQP